MAKKKRELLKFREGDCGLKIRKDGQLEVAGVDEAGGIIDEKGMVNPVLLFAAAWARRDQNVFQVLLDNFKESVREGFFGPDAKRDYEKADKVKKEHEASLKAQEPPVPFLNPDKIEEPVLDPASKPRVIDHDPIGNEFETHSDVASGAVTLTDGGCGNADSASGAVTFEQPEPLDIKGHLDRRDS